MNWGNAIAVLVAIGAWEAIRWVRNVISIRRVFRRLDQQGAFWSQGPRYVGLPHDPQEAITKAELTNLVPIEPTANVR